ncbi:MAG: methyltransferase domain-containing protein [Candidatus Lokiarchaeota archaeon]|nr:methyltransferase domain-containing protein [Candidatus Lokiarchaeota archaeon]
MSDLAKADWSDSERVRSIATSYQQRYGEGFWEELTKLVTPIEINTVCDFGCGPGLFLQDAVQKLGATKVIGMDASTEMLAYAKNIALADLTNVQVDIIEIDFDIKRISLPSDSISFGFSGYMMHEVKKPLDFASQVYGTIKTAGGYAVFDFISGDREEFIRIMSDGHMSAEKARKRYPHMCKHSINDLEDILDAVGFSPITSIKLDPIRAIVFGIKKG